MPLMPSGGGIKKRQGSKKMANFPLKQSKTNSHMTQHLLETSHNHSLQMLVFLGHY